MISCVISSAFTAPRRAVTMRRKTRKAKCGIERIGTETMLGDERIRIGRDVDDAEEAHVVVRQPRAVLEFEDDARKSRLFGVVAVVEKIAAHAEVQMQPRRAGVGEEMLAVTPDLREFASNHRPLQRRSAHAEDPLIEHAHGGDALVQRMLREVAAVQLDLR